MKQMSWVVAALFTAALAPLARPAMAVTKTPFTTTGIVVAVDPGTPFVSGHVLHLRGATVSFVITGALAGSLDAVENAEIDLADGSDTEAGTFVWTTATVTWEGTLRAKTAAPGVQTIGSFVGHGTDGSLLKGTFIAENSETGGITLTGTIVAP